MNDRQKPVYGSKIITPESLLEWTKRVFEPDTSEGKTRYSVTQLFSRENESQMAGLKRMKAACVAVAMEAFGTTDDVKMPFKDGNDLAEKLPHYANTIFIEPSTSEKPGVCGPDPKEKITLKSDLYRGCIGRTSLVPASWVWKGKRGVKFYLNNVQKIRDGERLGGGSSDPDQDFDSVDAGIAAHVAADESIPF